MSVKETSTVENASSPGMQLRRAREQAGVSLEFIAERTLISLHKLRALENDDFAGVGGRAYATGYTRAYARVVGVDAKDIVRNIEAALGAEPSRSATAATRTKSAESGASSNGTDGAAAGVPWLYPAVIALLVVLLVVWVVMWFSNREHTPGDEAAAPAAVRSAEPVVPNSEEPSIGSAPDSAVDGPDTNVIEELPAEAPVELEINRLERPSQQPAVEEAADPLPPMPEEVLAATPDQDATIAQPAESEPAEADSSGLATAVRQNINAEVPDPAQEVAPAEDPQAAEDALAVANDQLQLSFTEECWLEVSDATGRTLLADLARAGQTREVRGVAPFRVVLGDAQAAARITYNGEDVSFAPRPGRRVLRLTIGE